MQYIKNIFSTLNKLFQHMNYFLNFNYLNTVKELRTELKRKSDELEQTLENISDMFLMMDESLVVTYGNTAAKSFLGRELIGKKLMEIPAIPDSFVSNFVQAIREKKSFYFEDIGPISRRQIEVNLYPSKEGGLAVFFKDITEKKNLEKEIINQKEYLESIVNNISDCFFALDKNFIFTFCNTGTKNFYGYDPTGKRFWECVPPVPIVTSNFQKAVHEQKSIYLEMESTIRKNRWNGVSLYPANDGGLSVFFRNIDEIRRVNESLRQANERFLKAFNLNPNLMTIVSLDDETFLDVNEAFVNVSGLKKEEIIGRRYNEINLLINEEQREELRKQFKKGGFIFNHELKFRKGNTIRIGLLSSERIDIGGTACIMNVITDITDKKQLDEEMARYASLNIVGEMAASIAHEVRNPMTTVRGYLQVFQCKPEFADYHDRLGLMIEELDRANTIITEFLSLAKNKARDVKQSNLNSIINTLLPLVQADALHSGIEFKTDLQATPALMLDEKEIRQLVLNLVRNAFEAMAKGGRASIKTYSNEYHITLEVTDSGKGIPKNALEKLGTPFFTTKENGTGLGLAVCFRIAQRHNAKIEFFTSAKGTTVKVLFPVLKLQ